jgi:integrase
MNTSLRWCCGSLSSTRPCATYRSLLGHHLTPALGDLPISEVSAERIERLIGQWRTSGSRRRPGRPLSDATIASLMKVPRVVLGRARRRGLVGDVLGQVEFRRGGPRPANADPFSADELRRLIGAASQIDPDFGVFVEMWARIGARAGEMAALRPEDLDPDTATVLIRRTLLRDGRTGPTKTDRERRSSYAHPILETETWQPSRPIAAMMTTKLRRLKRQPLDPQGYLFTSGTGEPWGPSQLHTHWRRAMRAAGLRYRPPAQLATRWRRGCSRTTRRCYTSRWPGAGRTRRRP